MGTSCQTQESMSRVYVTSLHYYYYKFTLNKKIKISINNIILYCYMIL